MNGLSALTQDEEQDEDLVGTSISGEWNKDEAEDDEKEAQAKSFSGELRVTTEYIPTEAREQIPRSA